MGEWEIVAQYTHWIGKLKWKKGYEKIILANMCIYRVIYLVMSKTISKNDFSCARM